MQTGHSEEFLKLTLQALALGGKANSWVTIPWLRVRLHYKYFLHIEGSAVNSLLNRILCVHSLMHHLAFN